MVGGNKQLMLMFMTTLLFLLAIVSTTHARHGRKNSEFKNFRKVTRDNKQELFSTNEPRAFFPQTNEVKPHGLNGEQSQHQRTTVNPYQYADQVPPPLPKYKTVAEQYSFDADTTTKNNVDAYQPLDESEDDDDEKKKPPTPAVQEQSQYNHYSHNEKPETETTTTTTTNNNPFSNYNSVQQQQQQQYYSQNEINPESEEEEILPEEDDEEEVLPEEEEEVQKQYIPQNTLDEQIKAYLKRKQHQDPAAVVAKKQRYKNQYSKNQLSPPTKPEQNFFMNNDDLTAYLNAVAGNQQRTTYQQQQNRAEQQNEIKPENDDKEEEDAFFSKNPSPSDSKFDAYKKIGDSNDSPPVNQNQPPPVNQNQPPPPAPTKYFFDSDATLNAYLNAKQEKTTTAFDAQTEDEKEDDDDLMSNDNDNSPDAESNTSPKETKQEGLSDTTYTKFGFDPENNQYKHYDELYNQFNQQSQSQGNAFSGSAYTLTANGQYEQVPYGTHTKKDNPNGYYPDMFRSDP